MQEFYSNGKLLITGEYLVLDGALALAVPTKLGQSLCVESIDEPKLQWKSLDENGTVWFEDIFLIKDINSERQNHPNEISQGIVQIIEAVKQLKHDFISSGKGYKITTSLDFPKNWGLGTSSTLINNIANWTNVDAYELLARTFGGSGYDIACAQYDSPIFYQIEGDQRRVKNASFNPDFKDCIYFVYLNKKQNSRKGIANYRANIANLYKEISEISDISEEIISCKNLDDFNLLINTHEQIISKIIHQKPIKEQLFSDFEGSIKSLGAWGGDFVLVASKENPSNYFIAKGFKTILTYDELIK